MLAAGIPLGGGTDATRPASYNPFVSLYWMVTGRTVGGTQITSDESRLSRLEALRLYTTGSAWFIGEEDAKGTIATGQYADFAILSADYLAVGDEEARVIYHFAIHGTNAKEIGSTELRGSSDVVTFYIQKPYVVGADAGNENVAMWDYPAGGSPVKVLSGQFDLPIGVIVSVGKKR